ncbi:MAG TPA: glycosyl transferase family 2 [Lachnospiraceae bacterium]|jgi:rhamnosyltransferase|nr:glycosyl transferase family 2 [Lachnospiraceae bacterium]HBY71066.1 glycosyl transferase family 2 [Lachnospiraceae bacterium]HCA70743.1 glycosyl transferase family 2 [Lachnospiraceae bacterium]HCM11866.1 glycosyl transferase family 2 [Lachnospiraceae bacterium]HCR40431.1 glycosyl transferase family 2 [Lachnospiraceae bacterium]
MEEVNNWENYSVDVFIPTYHSDEKLERLLTMLYRQTIKPNRVIILHTIEKEGQEQPLPAIPDSDISVIPIPKEAFDHGGTRKYGATLSNADILLFMTQDAIPADEYLIENLLKPYGDPRVSAAYARQIANDSSDIIEEFTRNFNYPKKSYVKSKADLPKMGIKTYFCSNVCASYRNDIYKKLGGFVKKTIFNEDMIMAAGMIEAGYRIAYSPEAKVIHSHRYSYLQQFTRNFDLGVSHNQYPDVFRKIKSESEGIKLVKKTLQFLIKKKEYLLIPDLILTSGFKYLGYQMGLHYDILPESFVLRCSMNKSYWSKENRK